MKKRFEDIVKFPILTIPQNVKHQIRVQSYKKFPKNPNFLATKLQLSSFFNKNDTHLCHLNPG